MPTFVLQSIIPLMFMLSIPGFSRKLVLILWPLTHLPDLDYLDGFGPHRAAGHNLFILIPFIAVGLWAWKRAKPELAQAMLIGTIYVGSHLAMDVFAGGITALYPLSLHTTCYYAEINVITATNTPVLDAGRCSFEGIPVVSAFYNWLPATESALLFFLLPATLVVLLWQAVARRRASAPERE